MGLGTMGGFKLQIEDRGAIGYSRAQCRRQRLHGRGRQGA
jgi:hypothetical protein